MVRVAGTVSGTVRALIWRGRDDSGSGLLLMLLAMGAISAFSVVLLVVGEDSLTRQHLERTADASALAAAASFGEVDCAAAAQVAHANGVDLTECSGGAGEAVVTVRALAPPLLARVARVLGADVGPRFASARAGSAAEIDLG